ncbi:MAG: HIT family protein [Candidatus Micrarchaeaceae archaeon]
MDDNCIFCMLGKNNPGIVFEDSTCYIIPDKYPSERGHTLVIAKEHHGNMLETPDETIEHMFVVSKKYGSRLKIGMGADGLNISTNVGKEAGQLIGHFHIHIIPRYSAKQQGFAKHAEVSKEDAEMIRKVLTRG